MCDYICDNCGPIEAETLGDRDTDYCPYCGAGSNEIMPLAEAYRIQEGKIDRLLKEVERLTAELAKAAPVAVPDGWQRILEDFRDELGTGATGWNWTHETHFGGLILDQVIELLNAAPPAPAATGCYDCGRTYGDDAWVEAVVPDFVWDIIRPEGKQPGCGILCIHCMGARIKANDLGDVPVWLCGTEPYKAMAGDPSKSMELLREWKPGEPAPAVDEQWKPIHSAPVSKWILVREHDDVYKARLVVGNTPYWEAACGQPVSSEPAPLEWRSLP